MAFRGRIGKVMGAVAMAAAGALALSCGSTTKVLEDGQYRLYENKVVVTNKKQFPETAPTDLKSYIKQTPNNYYLFHWNPRLSIYNWGAGKTTGLGHVLREKIGVEPVVFDDTVIESSKEGILSHLEFLGFYGSTVRDSVILDEKKKLATVVYDITLGKQYPICDINYIIPNEVMQEMIDRDSANFTIHRGMPVSESILEDESDRMAQLFRDNGFFNFTKNYFFYFADSTTVRDSAMLIVKMENYTRNESSDHAREHRQYRIRQVEITPVGNFRVRRNFLNSINRIKPGDLYRESAIANTYSRFTSVPLFSNVNMQLTEVDTTLLDCSIRLTPAKLQGVQVSLEGSVNSSSLFGISPQISYTHRNVFGGGERLAVDLMGNFQFKFHDDVHANEFGVATSLSFPTFLFLPDRLFQGDLPSTDFKLSYNYQSRPEYTRSIISSTYGYRFNSNHRFYWQIFPLQMSIVRLYSIDQSFFEKLHDPFLQYSYKDHFDLGAGMQLYFKENNYYIRWQNDLAGNLLSLFNGSMRKDEKGSSLIWGVPYAQYVRSDIQAVYTHKFADDRFSLAGRIMAGAGVAYGNSTVLPFERLFSAGGASSMRGWQTRSVGPGMADMDSTFAIPNQTGDMHLEANVEFRFPIYKFLRGALFYDAGNVWNLPKSLISPDDYDGINPEEVWGMFSFVTLPYSIAQNWGLGIRLDFNSIMLRVDFGMQTYDPSEARWKGPYDWFHGSSAFHFGVGLPF